MSAGSALRRLRPSLRPLTAREEWLLVVLLSVVFAVFLLMSGFSPGVIQDTLNTEEMGASLAAQLRQGQRPNWSEAPCFLYHGSLMGYVMLPFFYLFGTSWALVRLWPVAFGFLTLWLTYAFVRRLFGRAAAALTLLLLIVHPSFVMGVKMGNFQCSAVLAFTVGAVYGLYRWWETRRWTYLVLGMLVLGLGVGTRLWFSFFVAALFASALFFAGPLRDRFHARDLRRLAGPLLLGGGAFLLGALPVIYTEVSRGMPFFHIVSLEAGSRGWSWNPHIAFRGFQELLDGTVFHRLYFDDLPSAPNAWYIWAVAASWAYVARAYLRGPVRLARGPMRWLAVFSAMFFLVFTFSPKALEYHLFVVYPFPQMLIAAAAVEAARSAGRRLRGLGAVALVLAAGLAAKDVHGLARFLDRVSAQGGVKRTSDAVYDVGRWLIPYVKGRPVFVVVPEYLATNLNLYFPDADLKYQFDVMYQPFTSVRSVPSKHAEELARKHETYEVLKEALRRSPARWDAEGAFAQGFYKAWERDLGPGEFREAVFIGHPAADFWYTSYFFLLWCHWGERHGRDVRLIARFPEKDGRPAFEAYSMGLAAEGKR